MTASALVTFLAATLALNLTPGQDMLYVIARSLGGGRRAGIVSALGISLGCVGHTLAVAGGLAGLLAARPQALEMVRYLGAGYLVYLGARQLFAQPRPMAGSDVPAENSWSTFRQGTLTNLLNPKVALFFLAFLPQFVTPGSSHQWRQLLLLGALFNLSGTSVNLLVAVGAGRIARYWERHPIRQRRFTQFTGLVLIALGLRLALGKLDAPRL